MLSSEHNLSILVKSNRLFMINESCSARSEVSIVKVPLRLNKYLFIPIFFFKIFFNFIALFEHFGQMKQSFHT